MDFAAEPVMDAFTPPPRTATRSNAPSAESGPSFDEHLDAVNDSATSESAAPAYAETKIDAAPIEAKPATSPETQPQDQIDPDAALLGAPLPAPPQIAAPVLVQIAATQAAPTQSQPAETPAAPAPVNAAPQAPAAPTPTIPEATTPVQTAAPIAPKSAKTGSSEAKSAPATTPAPQTSNTPPPAAASPQAETAAQQTAPTLPNADPIAVQQLPDAVRQAIAATIAPAPQVTEALQRTTRAAPQAVETKATDANAAKSAPAAPNAAVKPQTAKAVTAAPATSEAAPAAQTSSTAADSAQITSANATTTATQASTHVQHAAADTGTQRAAPAAAQVAREIVRRFDGGNTSFELRLDPAELGRVEIRMDVSRDHKVTAVITADNPQALTELARQARELEAQLQSAGLQLSDNGLSFDLRQGAQGGDGQEANGAQRGGAGGDAPLEQAQTPTARPIGFERWRGVRVDMMV